jgi:calcium homeostasis ER protein
MTKLKQKDNPKFSFLFGGEYNDYYNYKLATEHLSKCLAQLKI